MCMPGDNVEMTIELIHPVAMEQGLTFAIREGGRTVGSGTCCYSYRVILYYSIKLEFYIEDSLVVLCMTRLFLK